MAVPDIVHDACGIKDKNMRVPEYTEQGNALLTYWNRGTDFDWSQLLHVLLQGCTGEED